MAGVVGLPQVLRDKRLTHATFMFNAAYYLLVQLSHVKQSQFLTPFLPPSFVGETSGSMAESGPRSVSLRILSPTIAGHLDIPDVQADTTVGALKQRLTETVPSHPPPNIQRLIYYGRMLADDNETLAHLFGESLVCSVDTWLGLG